jgi:hypothetical protein
MATAAPTGFVSRTKVRGGVDPVLAKEQLEALQILWRGWGAELFCSMFVSILLKRPQPRTLASGQIVNTRLQPYVYHRINKDMETTFTKRNITLKPRQIGATTYHIIRRLYLPSILEPGTSSLLVSQTKPYGLQHFAILQRAHKHFMQFLPVGMSGLNDLADELHKHVLHTQYSPRHELVFDFLDSRILVDTSENTEVGQGLPGISHLVCTESARWKTGPQHSPEEAMANVKEAVHSEGTIDIESTANGMGGYFFEECQRAKKGGEFTFHFYPWWYMEEYEEPKTKLNHSELNDRERELIKQVQLTLGQVQWRRDKIESLRHNFPEKYPEDDLTCFLTSGSPFFETQILVKRKLELLNKKPLESHGNGDYLVYKRRIKGRQYIMGIDVAEGKEVSENMSDFTDACVWDLETAEEVASYRCKLPPEDAAEECVDIAREYNNAVMAIERNNHGGAFILTVQKQLLYGNVYYHKEWYREQGSKNQVREFAGFPTNVRTRPIALNKLAAVVRDVPELVNSKVFVDEALTFVRDKKTGKPAGQAGCHDDAVMSRAIASYARLVRLGYLDPIEAPSEKYGETEVEEDKET